MRASCATGPVKWMVKNGSQVSNRKGVVRKILTCLLHATRERCEWLKYWILKPQDECVLSTKQVRSNGQGDKNHVALNFSRVYILIPAANSNLRSIEQKSRLFSPLTISSQNVISWAHWRSIWSCSWDCSKFTQDWANTNRLRWETYNVQVRVASPSFFWRPFLFYLQSIQARYIYMQD